MKIRHSIFQPTERCTSDLALAPITVSAIELRGPIWPAPSQPFHETFPRFRQRAGRNGFQTAGILVPFVYPSSSHERGPRAITLPKCAFLICGLHSVANPRLLHIFMTAVRLPKASDSVGLRAIVGSFMLFLLILLRLAPEATYQYWPVTGFPKKTNDDECRSER